jgi:hypothetical protein
MSNMEKFKIDNVNDCGCVGPIDIFVKDQSEGFAKELLGEIESAREQKKKIEYYSDSLIIYTMKYQSDLGQEIIIFEVINQKGKSMIPDHYYLANKSLYPSYLLYLINKSEQKER